MTGEKAANAGVRAAVRTWTAIVALAATIIACLFAACATQAVTYTVDRKLFVEADSLFRSGNYEYAMRKYTKIRDTYPHTSTGANAQYTLGYIHVYYENPFADYEAALREFTLFVKTYPGDRRVDEVNNWIRILTSIRDFSAGYNGSRVVVSRIKSKEEATTKNYQELQEAYLACDAKVDSLQRRVIILQGTVETLERIITELEKIR